MIRRTKQGRFGFSSLEKSGQGTVIKDATKDLYGSGKQRIVSPSSKDAKGAGTPPWKVGSHQEDDAGGTAEPDRPYLEKKHNTVEKEIETQFRTVEIDYVYVGCSCRSRFCPDCSEGQGILLRERVRSALKKWKHCQMWTLTVDPKIFNDDPKAAFEYCKEKRVIGELVKALRRKEEFKIGRHYFCAVEWQKKTEFVHYHLLLETEFIPFDIVCHYWNLNRPKWATISEEDQKTGRPKFGSVRYTSRVKKINTVAHAINYATKYVIKYPDHGFPDWVMNYPKKIDRYHISQSFWRQAMTQAEIEALKKPEVLHSLDCTCDNCVHEHEPRSNRKTHTERLDNCKTSGIVLQRKTVNYPGGEQRRYYGYCFPVDGDFIQVANSLENYEGKRETVLTLHEYAGFKQAGRWSSDFEYDVHFSEQHLVFIDRPAIYEGEFQDGVIFEGNIEDATF
ncbi:hypothetical protein [Gimesia aquarii]|uniref:Replication-associated protein ORF2/G2P domain-containing protein n=1 Tax=Gimesia aquarii TaxID=2527964 RepID=A0A517WW26_9PLAN|nr:hypothetical protein [Gimesia aquarii]QDU09473.1 hypothetical protein V202x_28480 [Gimesia aquarii]